MKVLKGGTLIDGTGAGPQAGATVVIGDGRIGDLPIGKYRALTADTSLTVRRGVPAAAISPA